MLHHIEVYVSDLDRSREFYAYLLPKLGYSLFQDWEEGFSFKDEDYYLVFVQTREKYLKGGYNRCNIGLNHIAFVVSCVEEIEEIRTELIRRGTSILYEDRYPYAGGEGHYALYFEDPDRIKLEVVAQEKQGNTV